MNAMFGIADVERRMKANSQNVGVAAWHDRFIKKATESHSTFHATRKGESTESIDERNIPKYDCTHRDESNSLFGNPFPVLHY